MTVEFLIVSWHQNNLEINGILGVGTEEVVFFFISHYSSLTAKSNSDSAVSHTRLRDTINPIQLNYTITILEVSYKETKRMEIVKLNVVVCYLFH